MPQQFIIELLVNKKKLGEQAVRASVVWEDNNK